MKHLFFDLQIFELSFFTCAQFQKSRQDFVWWGVVMSTLYALKKAPERNSTFEVALNNWTTTISLVEEEIYFSGFTVMKFAVKLYYTLRTSSFQML